MSWLLPEGASLPFAGLEQPLLIEQGLGGGSQGQVFAVQLGGERLALKWYFPACIARDPQLPQRLEQSIRLGAPNRDFLWPLALLQPSDGSMAAFPAAAGGFGYLMGLRPEAFVGAHRHAGGDLEISLHTVLKACFHLAEAFHQLHLKGLCYKDVSLGNLFLEPSSGRILICDNDNVDVDGQSSSSVLGTPGFMAPEVLLGQAKPSARSDLFSLAVLLFRLITRHDPFRGKREMAIRCLDEPARRKLYGEEALFIFDPNDPSNRPDPIEHSAALVTWPIYPTGVQKLFLKSFGAGLHHPEQRTLTGQWKEAFSQCLDQRQICTQCNQETFSESESHGMCWNCKAPLPPQLLLELPNALVRATEGNELHPHHFNPLVGQAIDTPLARLIAHPAEQNLLGLKNLTCEPWQGLTTGGQNLEVNPGKTCNLAAIQQINSNVGSILVLRP